MNAAQTPKWEDDISLNTETRDLSQIRRVLIVTMLLNFAATGVKMAAGIMTGAISVVADSLDNLFDGLSNIVGLAGLYAAAQPPDAEHPYGHRKFETLAALSIAFLLFLTALQLLQTAWQHFWDKTLPEVNLWTAAAMLIGMLVQAYTSWYEMRAGRRLKSEILVADAMHTGASILVSISVLGGLGLIKLGFQWADPLLAAGVALMIAKIGMDVLKETLPVLVDKAALAPEKIIAVVAGVPGVESFHRVRSRGAAGSAAIDLHIRVAPEKTLREANAIADEVRRRLLELETVTDVIVHFEASRTQTDAADLAHGLRLLADELGLTIHEMEIASVDGELEVDVHVGVSPALTLGQAHELMDQFERQGRGRFPAIQHIHTHIELATTEVQNGLRVSFELEQQVEKAALALLPDFPDLANPHNIHVRHSGAHPDGHFMAAGEPATIAMHCVISPDTPIDLAHQLASEFERELLRRLDFRAEISVHLEPPDHVEN
jgi:cation diffusion facilitator family transporter